MKTQVATSKSELEGNKRNAGAVKVLFQKLGPGLITGASDDDPSGIATYSQEAAVRLWPSLDHGLDLSAHGRDPGDQRRIGRVTGIGIAANLRENYPKPVLRVFPS